MKPEQRYEWIVNYLNDTTSMAGKDWFKTCDVLDESFVDKYEAATGAKVDLMPYGANKCKQLGRDLATMHNNGILSRYRVGLPQMGGYGFPKWVYVYQLESNHVKY